MFDKTDAELAIKRSRWSINNEVAQQACCFAPTKAANMATGHFGNGCGATA